MSDAEQKKLAKRVAALESTLGSLIAWLHRELGSDAVGILLKRIDEGKEP